MERFCSGFTRGGKTKFVVNEIIEELRFGKRPVIVSLALKLDPWVNSKGVAYRGLIEELRRRFGSDFQARERIKFLTDDQVKRFWNFRCRQSSWDLAEMDQVDKDNWAFDGVIWRSAFYAIDECHLHFRKEDWRLVGNQGQAYASQNARAGDDIWLITQRAELVAKPFRDQSVECIWMVNHFHRRIGMFRGVKRISYEVHLSTPPSPGDPPLSGGTLEFKDDWLNGVYDTAAGGRVVGGDADIGTHAKGLHLGWGAAMAFGGIMALMLFFIGCMKGANWGSRKVFSALDHRRGAVREVETNMLAAERVVPRIVAGPVRVAHEISDVRVTGWAGGRVYLSDGAVIEGARVVKTATGVSVNGNLYRWAR